MTERRQEIRKCVIDKIRIGRYSFTASVLNASKKGLCIETDANLEKGKNYDIYPGLNTSTLTKNLTIEIRWKKFINDSFSGKYRYGLMLSKLNFHSHNCRYLGLNSKFTTKGGNYD